MILKAACTDPALHLLHTGTRWARPLKMRVHQAIIGSRGGMLEDPAQATNRMGHSQETRYSLASKR